MGSIIRVYMCSGGGNPTSSSGAPKEATTNKSAKSKS